jgi:hypothetical protein
MLTSASAMWSNAFVNFLCAQGAQQGARCAKLADALTDAGCAVTDAAGRATLSSVRLRSDALLADRYLKKKNWRTGTQFTCFTSIL